MRAKGIQECAFTRFIPGFDWNLDHFLRTQPIPGTTLWRPPGKLIGNAISDHATSGDLYALHNFRRLREKIPFVSRKHPQSPRNPLTAEDAQQKQRAFRPQITSSSSFASAHPSSSSPLAHIRVKGSAPVVRLAPFLKIPPTSVTVKATRADKYAGPPRPSSVCSARKAVSFSRSPNWASSLPRYVGYRGPEKGKPFPRLCSSRGRRSARSISK